MVLKTKLFFLETRTVHILCEHLSPGDESACHPKPKYLRQAERNPFDAGTIWRTAALDLFDGNLYLMASPQCTLRRIRNGVD
jgi:hypothetical protein